MILAAIRLALMVMFGLFIINLIVVIAGVIIAAIASIFLDND